VALNGVAYPRGSSVGVSLRGNVGLQAVVAQGSRSVGPTLTMTRARGNVCAELSGRPALEALEAVARQLDPKEKELIRTGGLLCGVAAPKALGYAAPQDDDKDAKPAPPTNDFLVRQIIGVGKQGELVVGAEVQEGDAFRFQVRDAETARADLRLMCLRAKTERLFSMSAAGDEDSAGAPQEEKRPTQGRPLAGLQVSCVARGRGLFGEPGVDSQQILTFLGGFVKSVRSVGGTSEDGAALGGFFANGEIGPVGIAGFSGPRAPARTHVHGFTTVLGVIADYSNSDSGPE